MNFRLTPVRPVLAALLLVGTLVGSAVGSFAQQVETRSAQPSNSDFLPIRDDDLLVLEVRLDRRSTGHGLLAFQPGDLP